MKFFVPGKVDADAAWERMRQVCRAPDGTRPIYSMSYEDAGAETVATVGEAEVAAIIFGGTAFYIVGAAGTPRSISVESIMETEFFDDA